MKQGRKKEREVEEDDAALALCALSHGSSFKGGERGEEAKQKNASSPPTSRGFKPGREPGAFGETVVLVRREGDATVGGEAAGDCFVVVD
jgi:hypothetical protein